MGKLKFDAPEGLNWSSRIVYHEVNCWEYFCIISNDFQYIKPHLLVKFHKSKASKIDKDLSCWIYPQKEPYTSTKFEKNIANKNNNGLLHFVPVVHKKCLHTYLIEKHKLNIFIKDPIVSQLISNYYFDFIKEQTLNTFKLKN